MRRALAAAVPLAALALYLSFPKAAGPQPARSSHHPARPAAEDPILDHADRLLDEGRRVFRDETFGDEDFWGGQLRLHEAIAGQANGGVGPGLSPRAALSLGLKVDAGAVPPATAEAVRRGEVNLDDPAVTVALLRADAVLGVKGQFDDAGTLRSVGITCALCHSTVDDSFATGIGRRLDGWPNRDLDVGAIVASAPTLAPFAALLGTDEDTVRTVLRSWGPGRYDAELALDGKAFRPDGKTGATLLPAAFGLAGVNLHTYTGFGSVTYWNAFVANTQMHGKGMFFDPRLADATRFPIAAKAGFADVRSTDDRITPRLAALHFYQLAIPAPKPPEGSFDADAAARGKAVFEGKGKCATCHVPPLYTEPGFAMHTAAELGIDDFQASRSPEQRFYRTTPLAGLFTRAKGGYYHDGRFPTLESVVAHYADTLGLELTPDERADLVQFLRSL
ncbi:hypothetical protein [Anaeromyxobacter soli]|uniref:hypothetical protein n=1 Tax=Anaeromyxobacter soli TaxID=2922725 RepID=UPI001FB01666|nr:hypothetical protein [Anaeromyxobacter sp. SG29]